jgi:hypothetical protein
MGLTMTGEDRAYAARRIDKGVYLQPSNDGNRYFVIASYKDGRINGLQEGPWIGTYWAWGPVTEAQLASIERMAAYDPESALSDLRYYATGHETGYPTKREAVAAALERDARS